MDFRHKARIKERINRILSGFAWATTNGWYLCFFLAAFTCVVFLIAWHTEQALCRITGAAHLYGTVYILFGICGAVTLAHESEHVWKHNWMKVPIGIASVLFLYYCLLDALWWIAAALLRLPAHISAYGTAAMMVLSCAVVAAGFRNTKKMRIVPRRIRLGSSGKQYRIALVSDIHLGAYVGPEHVGRIAAAINRLHPDLTVIAGDLIDDDHSVLKDHEALDRAAAAFRTVESRDGVVMALGNHDPAVTEPGFLPFLEKSRITLLHNEVMELSDIQLFGRSDPTHNDRLPLLNLTESLTQSKPAVVIDHDPRYIGEAAARRMDVVLSGHTHAGQFFPATVVTRMAVGRTHFYGQHTFGNTHAVISSGAGFFNLPVRLGTHNEIVDLILEL